MYKRVCERTTKHCEKHAQETEACKGDHKLLCTRSKHRRQRPDVLGCSQSTKPDI